MSHMLSAHEHIPEKQWKITTRMIRLNLEKEIDAFPSDLFIVVLCSFSFVSLAQNPLKGGKCLMLVNAFDF